MAQAPRPSAGQTIDPKTIAPSRTISQDHNQGHSNSPALGGVDLELQSNPIIEGILGPNKDGRVRNPVPSKLKGKTDNKQGNFGVMHMGMSPGKKSEAQGRDAAAERDAAARRTSENTASRAKAAQSEKYVPPKKRGIEPSISAQMGDAQAGSRGSPFAVSRPGPSRPLAPDETKYEQARLLTLLRTIQPITVVDQICKAVAYFGGIPGAPPPEDGIFPESANTRETGALFIGWLAEIFPDLTARSPEVPKEAAHAGGKKKGRPTKNNKATPAIPVVSGGASHELPNSQNGYGYGPAVSAPTWGLPQSLALVNTPAPASILPGALPPSAELPKELEQQSPNTPAKQQVDDNPDSAANKRRRGRPKGSTNKKKADGLPDNANNGHADGEIQDHQAPDSPEAQISVAKVAQMNNTPSTTFTPVQNNQAAAVKPAQALQYSDQSWQVNAQQNQVSQAPGVPDEFSPEERAVLEAFRHHNTDGMNLMPSPVVPVKGGPEAGQKRKRPPPKPKAVPVPPPAQKFPSASPQVVQNSLTIPTTTNNDTSMGMAKDALQWAPVDTTTPAPPPTKRPRQRKPKAPSAADPPSRTQTASVVSSATPPIPPSTIPDSQATASQQSMQQSVPVSRPPAEGLEAHYERFANLQQQQNGRSHTPTMPQQQVQQQQVTQQHVRQQSKPSPAPLHQSIPQAQQMQQQKSQQGSQQSNAMQRDDQKLTQVNSSSTRPTSTGFYTQRNTQNSNTYSQQYPSHQPSQLYANHQASPQLSNNTYRTSSTHTLAQASPQFTQAENTYRTASPHTITQPSPSFSQPDTSNRTSSTYSMTQPSPSFSQAENSYRTPSTNTMAQPTPPYTTARSHTQAQQTPHSNPYGNFSDQSYIDLPTLDSLGHTSASSNSNVGLSAGYGQALSLGNNSRSAASNSNGIYGSSSGLSNAFDTSSHDLLRGVSRSNHSNTAYGTPASGLNAFDTSTNEYERERLMRGLGRR